MSIDAGQLAARLIVGVAGPVLADAERQWLRRWQPAGVILFARNCRDLAQWRRLVADLRAVLPAAELCADHEGGPVSFLQAVAGRPPAPRTLGDLDDVERTQRVHRETGRRLRELGLDRVLAPCCDVLTEPGNPVIGARAFGVDSALVARHAAAAMAGLAAAGLAGCAKHWPGHGHVRFDTHETGTAGVGVAGSVASDTTVDASREAVLRPFLAALAAGATQVMIAHLPAGPDRLPASIDPGEIAVLRGRVGPRVLLVSDDVSMGALRAPLALLGIDAGDGRSSGLADPAILSLDWLQAVAAAGCDRLLLRGIPWRALPLPSGASGPRLPDAPAPLDLMEVGPPSALYAETRQLAAAAVALRPGSEPMLWFDATGADRLGEAAGLLTVLGRRWPRMAHLDARIARLAPDEPYTTVLITSHRPLTVAQAQLLAGLVAPAGTAVAAGHPSLAGDLRRLLGDRWQVDAIYDVAAPDLQALPGGDASAPPPSSPAGAI
ncbi:MAG: glycoside hydrolase family 3 N-terminal domain-containing protein [Candidatus Krumholzibacteria bacterium]|jgi:hypothetical protein|nr:glycoside hydrolase family 3 N-terminal domain-containing protein [Candidatus Krumholzibacteria bacterium]